MTRNFYYNREYPHANICEVKMNYGLRCFIREFDYDQEFIETIFESTNINNWRAERFKS